MVGLPSPKRMTKVRFLMPPPSVRLRWASPMVYNKSHMSEKLPTPEFTESELELIQKLKDFGPEHEEVQKLLGMWIGELEKWATQENTSRATIEVNLKRAKLYRAAGFIDDAWANLNSVHREAIQEDLLDLYEEAKAIMDEIVKEFDEKR